ncbi:MAG: preprotein translocase subunit YajC [bacterium]|nr:preprotein translocase subunit YajC [bacterium]
MSYPLVVAAASGEQGLLGALVPMIVIFGIFYLIWFMPLRKKQKALEGFLARLKKGDQVVTNGGLHGEVTKVEGDIVVLKLAENVKVRVSRRAIAGGPPEKGEGHGS